MHKEILKILQIKKFAEKFDNIEKLYKVLTNLKEEITVNMIIKYAYSDAYISLAESLKHAAYYIGKNIKFNWIDVRNLQHNDVINELNKSKAGILVPGGFGESGIENKMVAIEYARTNNVPFLGICYGMQLMVIEFARHVLGIKNANTEEIDPSNKSVHLVHIINPNEKKLGGTMRLGAYKGIIKQKSIAEKIYGSLSFVERHRHRYEINTEYRTQCEDNGLIFSGTSPDNVYMEIAEIPKLDFFVGVQYHPEFNSSIFKPNEMILAFIKTCDKYQNSNANKQSRIKVNRKLSKKVSKKNSKKNSKKISKKNSKKNSKTNKLSKTDKVRKVSRSGRKLSKKT